jgi:hypothetical protein
MEKEEGEGKRGEGDEKGILMKMVCLYKKFVMK